MLVGGIYSCGEFPLCWIARTDLCVCVCVCAKEEGKIKWGKNHASNFNSAASLGVLFFNDFVSFFFFCYCYVFCVLSHCFTDGLGRFMFQRLFLAVTLLAPCRAASEYEDDDDDFRQNLTYLKLTISCVNGYTGSTVWCCGVVCRFS